MITSQKLKGIKISLIGEGGKNAFYVYGITQDAIMKAIAEIPSLGAQPAEKAAPRRRGRRPKSETSQPVAAAA